MTPFFSSVASIEQLRAVSSSWLGVPFYPNGRTRAGVSCQMLVSEIYRDCGLFPVEFSPPDAPMTWAHANKESLIEKFVAEQLYGKLVEVSPIPLAGDLIGFRVGGCVQHCGICLGENFIHAMDGKKVQTNLVNDATFLDRMAKVWRPVKGSSDA